MQLHLPSWSRCLAPRRVRCEPETKTRRLLGFPKSEQEKIQTHLAHVEELQATLFVFACMLKASTWKDLPLLPPPCLPVFFLELWFSHQQFHDWTLPEEELGHAVPNMQVSIYCSPEWEENVASPSTTRCFKQYICLPELKGKEIWLKHDLQKERKRKYVRRHKAVLSEIAWKAANAATPHSFLDINTH